MHAHQQRLDQEYLSRWFEFTSSLRRLDVGRGRKFSWPFLLDFEAAPEYFTSSPRLMIVGRETNGWGEPSRLDWLNSDAHEAILKIREEYRRFKLGRCYRKPFNKLAWKFSQGLSIDPGCEPRANFILTNLLKLDEQGARPDNDVINILFDLFSLLAAEIEICAPDATIFFTGPDSDKDIARAMPGVRFRTVEGYDFRALVKLESPQLPECTYRTYHPGFLIFPRNHHIFRELLQIVRAHFGLPTIDPDFEIT